MPGFYYREHKKGTDVLNVDYIKDALKKFQGDNSKK